jgi:arsenite/tail-anchored protein-transporting ATPase
MMLAEQLQVWANPKRLLLTTDPAAHLGDFLDVPVGDEPAPVAGPPNLWAANIDPKAAAAVYKKRILDDARRRGRPQRIRLMPRRVAPCSKSTWPK